MNFEKSLAANNRLSRVAIPTILLVILIIFSFRLIGSEMSGTVIIILFVAYVILVALIIKGFKSKDIYYDSNNMYLKGDNGVTTVQFSSIRRIKMTLSNTSMMGLKFYQYKVEYMDSEATQAEIHFWTSIYSHEMEDFEKEIKEINPYVKVEHWAN
jgi:hypothetical protein